EADPERDANKVIALQEQESIRLLISYGFTDVGDNQRLYDHLLEELEDIEFQTPLYQEILLLYKNTIAAGKIPEPDLFIKNGSPEIRKEVINLIAERYEISQNW